MSVNLSLYGPRGKVCMMQYSLTTSEWSFSVKLPNWSSGRRNVMKAWLLRRWGFPAMERRRSSIPFICFLAPDFLSGRGIWRSMAGERERERERGWEGEDIEWWRNGGRDKGIEMVCVCVQCSGKQRVTSLSWLAFTHISIIGMRGNVSSSWSCILLKMYTTPTCARHLYLTSLSLCHTHTHSL